MQVGELNNNVEALLMAVKSTNDFEAELNKRFGANKSDDIEEQEEVRLSIQAYFYSSLLK